MPVSCARKRCSTTLKPWAQAWSGPPCSVSYAALSNSRIGGKSTHADRKCGLGSRHLPQPLARARRRVGESRLHFLAHHLLMHPTGGNNKPISALGPGERRSRRPTCSKTSVSAIANASSSSPPSTASSSAPMSAPPMPERRYNSACSITPAVTLSTAFFSARALFAPFPLPCRPATAGGPPT